MRRSCHAILAILLFVAANNAVAGANVNFILGERSLQDDETWEPNEVQSAFGAVGDFGGKNWPVQLAFGLNVSVDSADDVDVAIADLSFGVAYVALQKTRIRPYVGVGLSSVGVAIDRGGDFDFDDTDQSFGYYGNIGVYGRLGSRFNLGIDYRLLRGTDLQLYNYKFDADYGQVGLLLGFGWPSYK